MHKQNLRSYKKPFLARRLERKSRKRFIFTLLILGILFYSFLTWLLPTMIGGLSFLDQFKPEPEVQAPISEGITLAPPVLSIPFEATNSAAIKIKGYASPKLSVKIYVDNDLKDIVNTSDDGNFQSNEITLNTGTNSIHGQTSDNTGHTSLPSKTIFLAYLNKKPQLDITSPEDNQTITGDKKVTVSGKVTPKDGVSVTINGTLVILKDDGSFTQTIEINDGDNNLNITAKDAAGNITEATRGVTYQP
ncbi:MAG: Bacillopeptidase-like protein [Candidatus Daviesbacteria bacterium GW2011_GWA1_38_7]|nr:MAG: Bacillopeptidase-like protein [Candidatus Daviesbacteria bacterium GW2011_GWA1_38_7]